MYFRDLFLCLPVLAAAACTAPDPSDQVDVLAASIKAADAPLRSAFTPARSRETAAARKRAIAGGAKLYEFPDECAKLSEGNLDASVADCRLAPLFAVPAPRGSAGYALEGWSALQSYGETVKAIASSNAPTEIEAEFRNFLTATNGFFAEANKDPKFAVVDPSDIRPLSGILGNLAERARVRALRRLVNDSHDAVTVIVQELIAYSDRSDDLVTAMENLDTAYFEMLDRQDGGNAAAYSQAIERYEAQHESYVAQMKKSQAARLMSVWKANEALRSRINAPGDPAATLDLLEDIKALTED